MRSSPKRRPHAPRSPAAPFPGSATARCRLVRLHDMGGAIVLGHPLGAWTAVSSHAVSYGTWKPRSPPSSTGWPQLSWRFPAAALSARQRSSSEPPASHASSRRAPTPGTTGPRLCLCGPATEKVTVSAAWETASSASHYTASRSLRPTTTPKHGTTYSAAAWPGTPAPNPSVSSNAGFAMSSTGPCAATLTLPRSHKPTSQRLIDIGASGRDRDSAPHVPRCGAPGPWNCARRLTWDFGLFPPATRARPGPGRTGRPAPRVGPGPAHSAS